MAVVRGVLPAVLAAASPVAPRLAHDRWHFARTDHDLALLDADVRRTVAARGATWGGVSVAAAIHVYGPQLGALE